MVRLSVAVDVTPYIWVLSGSTAYVTSLVFYPHGSASETWKQGQLLLISYSWQGELETHTPAHTESFSARLLGPSIKPEPHLSLQTHNKKEP